MNRNFLLALVLNKAWIVFIRLSLSLADSQNNCIASDIVVEENYRDPLLSNNDDLAMVGLDAMQRANSTLEDFVSVTDLPSNYLSRFYLILKSQ